jgi:PHD/YefM family antitoxin component YafN of YafNO toxin-antitoxin module
MTHDVWQLEDAQKHLPEMAYSALCGEPQKIILRNHEVVILLSENEYRYFIKKEKYQPKNFIKHLMNIPKDEMEFETAIIKAREVDF